MKKSSDKKALDFFIKLTEDSSSATDVNKYIKQILSKTLTYIESSSGSILLYDPEFDCLKLYISSKHPAINTISAVAARVSATQGISGQVFQTAKPLIAQKATSSNSTARLTRKNDSGSFMSLPLIVNRKVTGVINFNRQASQQPFCKTDLKNIKHIATLIASLIEKETLLSEIKENKKETLGLYELTSLLIQPTDLSNKLKLFLKTLSDKLGLEHSAILAVNQGQKIEILASHRLKISKLNKFLSSISSRLKEFLLTDADTVENFDRTPPTLSFEDNGQVREMFCLLLKINSKKPHILLVSRNYCHADPLEANTHYRFLYMISQNLSIAIEREQMIQSIKENQKILLENAVRNKIFVDISKDLTSTLDPYLILQKSFEQFRGIISYTSISIILYDELESCYRLTIQPSEKITKSYQKKLTNKIKEILEEYPLKPPITKNNLKKPLVFNPHQSSGVSANTFKQSMHLPIIIGEKVTGLIHLTRKTDEHFTNIEFDIASQFTAIFVTSIKNAQIHKKTEMLAFTDPLTQLFNHRYFQETLAQELLRSKRYSKPLSLMIIDIDHFKKFNDTHGHQTGDLVLKTVAKVFEKSVREKIDTAARYGGEEFAIILPETDIEGAFIFAERIRKSVEKTKISVNSQLLNVTLSIGLANTNQIAKPTSANLIEAADKAMYTAKTAGRNQVKIFKK